MIKKPYKITIKDRSCQVTIPDIVSKVLGIEKEEVKKKKREEHINYFINKSHGYAIIVNSKNLDVKAPGLGPISLESSISQELFSKIMKKYRKNKDAKNEK